MLRPQMLLGTLVVILCLAMLASAGPAGGRVVVGLNIDANTLDPHFVSSTQEYGMLKSIYEHLVWFDPAKGEFQPMLATSWKRVGLLTWEFRLRQGVRFTNGEPFDAEAVKYTIERTIDPKVNSNNRFPGAVNLDRVKVVDPYTVRIITKRPAATMLTQLWILQLVPPKYFSSTPLSELARKPVGTGPYKVVEWVKDDHITLEANPDYWGPKPAIKTVVFRPIPEVSTRVAELQTGGVDVAIDIPPDQAKTLEANPNVQVERIPSGRRVFFGLRSDRPPLDNVKVRQALNYGLNFDVINQSLLSGMGQRLATYVVPPFGDPSLQPYPYDPTKAKQLLAEAGYPNGFDITLEVPVARYLKGEDISQAAAADWVKVGVRVKVVPLEWGVFVKKIFQERNPEGIYLLGLASAWNDIDDLYDMHPDFVFAEEKWRDPEYLDLYPKLVLSATKEQHQKLSYKLQEIIHDRGPMVMVWRQVQIYGVNKRLVWTPRLDDYIYPAAMQLK